MKLELLLNFHANLTAMLEVGEGPFGNRTIIEVQGGEFSSAKLKGKIREASCADWLTIHDGFGHLDVRATFETDDGAIIYVQYTGLLELTEGMQAAIAGEGETAFGDQEFFINPRMQTGDPRYSWVNNIFCVGRGRLLPGRVEYQVFQLLNDYLP
jgi:hypothetical protein